LAILCSDFAAETAIENHPIDLIIILDGQNIVHILRPLRKR
jgi:hypothetical protein